MFTSCEHAILIFTQTLPWSITGLRCIQGIFFSKFACQWICKNLIVQRIHYSILNRYMLTRFVSCCSINGSAENHCIFVSTVCACNSRIKWKCSQTCTSSHILRATTCLQWSYQTPPNIFSSLNFLSAVATSWLQPVASLFHPNCKVWPAQRGYRWHNASTCQC